VQPWQSCAKLARDGTDWCGTCRKNQLQITARHPASLIDLTGTGMMPLAIGGGLASGLPTLPELLAEPPPGMPPSMAATQGMAWVNPQLLNNDMMPPVPQAHMSLLPTAVTHPPASAMPAAGESLPQISPCTGVVWPMPAEQVGNKVATDPLPSVQQVMPGAGILAPSLPGMPLPDGELPTHLSMPTMPPAEVERAE
jgi:hypothetical protein